MISGAVGSVAWGFLRGDSRRSISLSTVFAIFSVAVGVAATVCVMAIVDGFVTTMESVMLGTLPPVQVLADPPWREDESARLEQEILHVPSVWRVQPAVLLHEERMRVGGTEAKGGQSARITLLGADFSPDKSTLPMAGLIDGGEARLSALSAGNQVIVSRGLANFARSNAAHLFLATERDGEARSAAFEVASVFHTGLGEFKPLVAVTNLVDAQRLSGMGGQVNALFVAGKRLADADKIKAELTEKFSGRNLMVASWRDLAGDTWDMLQALRFVALAGLSIIVLLASWSIRTSLNMAVIQKRKQIAVLRALGSTAGDVRQIFLLMGALIAGLGTLLGILAGLAVAQKVQSSLSAWLEMLTGMARWNVELDPVMLALVVLIVQVFAMLSAAAPARAAAHLDPVQGLRG